MTDETTQQPDEGPTEWNDAYKVVIAGSEWGVEMDRGEIVEIDLDDVRVSTPDVHDALRDALRASKHLDGYSIRTTRYEAEWGASGASTEVLLLIANAGLAVFLERGLELLLSQLRDRYADRDAHTSVTIEDAIKAARYRVAFHHNTNGPDLVLRSVTHGPGPIVIELEEPGGFPRYEVTILGGNASLSLTRIRRLDRD